MAKGKKYTAAEKQAYYMGLGAALGHCTPKGIKRTLSALSAKEKTSYMNGLNEGFALNMKQKK